MKIEIHWHNRWLRIGVYLFFLFFLLLLVVARVSGVSFIYQDF